VDADTVIREQVFPEPAVQAALREHFGPGIYAPDGQIDRAALGKIVFGSDVERTWLEELTHPPLFERLRVLLRGDTKSRWLVEMPLLFEKALENWFDFTVCVGCDSGTQLARLEQRGLDRALAEQRISKQLPLARKIELSDLVLWNDGSTAFLKAQVDRLVDTIPAAPAATPFPEHPNVNPP